MLTTRFRSRSHATGLQRDILLRRLASMPEGPVLGALAAEGAWPGMRASGGAWVRRLLKLEQLHRVLAALEQPQVMTILTLRRRALEGMNSRDRFAEAGARGTACWRRPWSSRR